jgi:hypothetical protein
MTQANDGDLGATGHFPRGKIHATDEGEIRLSVGTNPEGTVVILNFGSPVTWLGLPHKEAVELGEALLRHAATLKPT